MGDAWERPDRRRWLQLALGAIWLIDAGLQFQSFMFTKAFGRTLAGTAAGNPAVIAEPITWSARIIEAHPVPVNAVFAAIQLLIGLGIVWRPAVRIALATSVAWSLGVWWLGEGLGGVLTPDATTIGGAPGAVILYALLAVLLWPSGSAGRARSAEPAPFEAARAVGPRVARLLWLVLWGSLAWFAVGPGASRSGAAMRDLVSGTTSGEPSWLSAIGNAAAGTAGRHGLAVSVTLAAALAVVAAGIYAPRPAARADVVLAIAVSAVVWVASQGLGGIFTGMATDLQTGPLLILIAVAYWPLSSPLPVREPAPERLVVAEGP